METIGAKSVFHNTLQAISGVYEERECQSILFMLFAQKYQCSRMDVLMDKPIPHFNHDDWNQAIARIKQHEPIQYIMGIAWFLDRAFDVNAAVLIPRIETEELVNLILLNSSKEKPLNIIDLGTGSGCIAISLKLALPHATVYALDVDAEALAVAKQNAQKLGADIVFIHDDMRAIKTQLPLFDVVVSNPPYVRNVEKSDMQHNVLDFEPHLALFVDDEHPLAFYEAIAQFGNTYLTDNASLYLEINTFLGAETKAMLHGFGYQNVEVLKDIYDKDRMIIAHH